MKKFRLSIIFERVETLRVSAETADRLLPVYAHLGTNPHTEDVSTEIAKEDADESEQNKNTGNLMQ